MSFELYLQCFDRGKPAGIRREVVRGLFPVVEGESEVDYWLVRYDDSHSCHIGVQGNSADPESVESLCVFRPCDHPRLWEALLATMRLAHVVLYFPGCQHPLVAAEVSTAHLPPSMAESLGVPQVVNTGGAIEEAIRLT
jgi:hypothetical protein